MGLGLGLASALEHSWYVVAEGVVEHPYLVGVGVGVGVAVEG